MNIATATPWMRMALAAALFIMMSSMLCLVRASRDHRRMRTSDSRARTQVTQKNAHLDVQDGTSSNTDADGSDMGVIDAKRMKGGELRSLDEEEMEDSRVMDAVEVIPLPLEEKARLTSKTKAAKEIILSPTESKESPQRQRSVRLGRSLQDEPLTPEQLYYDSDWVELPPEIQDAYTILGFNQMIWDEELDARTETIDWPDLTEEEREAATIIGYTEEIWCTTKSPTASSVAVPDVATPPPTPRPTTSSPTMQPTLKPMTSSPTKQPTNEPVVVATPPPTAKPVTSSPTKQMIISNITPAPVPAPVTIYWADLQSGSRKVYEIMGYDEKSWNSAQLPPAVGRMWEELSMNEKLAIVSFGYDKERWNATPIEERFPSQPEKPSTVLNEEFCQVYYTLGDGKCEALRDSIRSEIRGQGTPTLELGDPSTKPVMLFFHGWPDTYALWANQFAHFCGEGGEYACVAPSMMDYNPDIPPADESKLFWPLQADMMHEVVTDLGLKDITLVIHDFGSIVGSQYVYRHPEHVKRVINMDVGNSPGALPELAEGVLPLADFQKTAIAAFRAKNDTMMDENVKGIDAFAQQFGLRGPPCVDCKVAPDSEVGVGYKTGWMHVQFVDGTWMSYFDTPREEWEFMFTPAWPDNIPKLFLWATPDYHSPELLTWLDVRGDGSGHKNMGVDHWFMTRNLDPTRDTVAETNDEIEKFIAATETGPAPTEPDTGSESPTDTDIDGPMAPVFGSKASKGSKSSKSSKGSKSVKASKSKSSKYKKETTISPKTHKVHGNSDTSKDDGHGVPLSSGDNVDYSEEAEANSAASGKKGTRLFKRTLLHGGSAATAGGGSS